MSSTSKLAPAATRYPRLGEPIIPRLLRPLVLDRRAPAPHDAGPELARLLTTDLGPRAWQRLTSDVCRRLGAIVVDRVQTRLAGLSPHLRETALPPPEIAARLTLEPRTLNVLRRAIAYGRTDGPWTLRRYLELNRFGARTLVDLLAATEAKSETSIRGVDSAGLSDGQALVPRLLAAISSRLPLAEADATAVLRQAAGDAALPVSPRWLAGAAVTSGLSPSFRTVDLGAARMIVPVGAVSAARAAYRIAVRLLQRQGTATISDVEERLRVSAGVPLDGDFVTRVLTALPSFRWIAPEERWFWFVAHASPVLADLRRIFAVAGALSLPRLWGALFRDRVGPRLSETAAANLAAPIPTAVVAHGAIRVARTLDRATFLGEAELRLLRLLEEAGRPLAAAEIREAAAAAGIRGPQVSWLLHRSPIFEQCPAGYHPLGALGAETQRRAH